MRKIFFALLLSFAACSFLHAQQNAISITNFTLSSHLPARISDWKTVPAAVLAVVQNNTAGDRPLKLLVNIKQDGKIICGIADGIPVDYFKSRSLNTDNITAALTNCEELKPGNYTLCMRFRGMSDTRQVVDFSTEVFKPFSVGNAGSQNFARPSIISPANGKMFTQVEIQQPVTFRWIPVVPAVKNVTYILRLWAIKEGQSSQQAMLAGSPLIEEKIANRTQYISTSHEWTKGGGISVGRMNNDSLKSVPATNPTPIPKRDYVVSVQALDESGNGIGENNGVSEPVMFSVASGGCIATLNILNDEIKCLGSANGLNQYSVCANYISDLTNTNNIAFNDAQNASLNSMPGHSLSNLIYDVNGGAISGITFTPSNAALISPGNTIKVCFIISTNQPAIHLLAFGLCKDGKETSFPNFANDDDSAILPSCICTFCEKEMKIIAGTGSASYIPQNIAHILQNFTVTPNNIIKITAEIVYVKDSVTSNDCRVCSDKESNVFQFINNNTISGFGNVTNPVYGINSTTPPSKRLTWISNSAAGISINPAHFDLNISLPATSTLDCCNQYDKICIRYTFWDVNCKACSKMVCYELYKKPKTK